jgi:hypothetical protein
MNRCIKTLVTCMAATAVSSFGVIALAPAASADTEGCVVRSEYQKVHKGMRKSSVQRIFDTNGNRQAIAHSGGYTSEIRSYRTCSQYSAVSVAFDSGPGEPLRVSAKSAVWVH